MKILIATGPLLAQGPSADLARLLRSRSHRVEFAHLPLFGASEGRVPLDMLVAASLEVTNTDHVIGIGFPACVLPFRRTSLWFPEAPPRYTSAEVGRAVGLAISAAIGESVIALVASDDVRDALAEIAGVRLDVVPALSDLADRLLP